MTTLRNSENRTFYTRHDVKIVKLKAKNTENDLQNQRDNTHVRQTTHKQNSGKPQKKHTTNILITIPIFSYIA